MIKTLKKRAGSKNSKIQLCKKVTSDKHVTVFESKLKICLSLKSLQKPEGFIVVLCYMNDVDVSR